MYYIKWMDLYWAWNEGNKEYDGDIYDGYFWMSCPTIQHFRRHARRYSTESHPFVFKTKFQAWKFIWKYNRYSSNPSMKNITIEKIEL